VNRVKTASAVAHVAFLRGINVGGHHIVPMKALAECFVSLGYTGVRTLLASGNVIFAAPRTDQAALEHAIAAGLHKWFGFEIGVLVRTMAELEKLHAADPFTGVADGAKLYVTFLKERSAPPAAGAKGIRITRGPGREILSVVTPASGAGSVDLMRILDQKFGKEITTRNWQTILRVVRALTG
jgi:uncharacterized protein (DUF1697 family)